MKRILKPLQCLVAAALMTAWLPATIEAKSYSSRGKSYSSPSRSSGSSSSRNRSSSSSPSRSSSPSKSSSSSSSSKSGKSSSTSSSRSSSSDRNSSKSFTSGSGKSYGAGSGAGDDNRKSYTSGKSYSSRSGQKSEPDSSSFSFDSAAARARREEASRKAFNQYKDSMRTRSTPPMGTDSRAANAPPRLDTPITTASRPDVDSVPPVNPSVGGGRRSYIPDERTINSRPWRKYETFAPYSSRPVVRYHDPYSSLFWWWLLDRSLDERANWAYHHRYDMDPARYQALVSENKELEQRVEQLESQQVKRDTNYMPENIDRDLMYSDQHVSRIYSNRRTRGGSIAFWLLAIPTALAMGCFLVWLVFFKRWQVSTS